MVTASHNPPDYNDMKFASEQRKPISADSGHDGHGEVDRNQPAARKSAVPGGVTSLDRKSR
jgi:phosphomannomutase